MPAECARGRALSAAGAVVFGKTNVPMLLADWQTFNPIYGTTNNPWNLERTPGGSSGGSAAALAAGLTGLEIGSDIGGSIRNPAHYCGVFGHKPTLGSARRPGMTARHVHHARDIAVIGPLARSATRPRTRVCGIMAGPDAIEAAWAGSSRCPSRTRKTLAAVAVAVLDRGPTARVRPAVQPRDRRGRRLPRRPRRESQS